jgi:two-component system CheB/CheR fusion protein
MDGTIIVTFAEIPHPKRRRVKGEKLTEAKHRELEDSLQLTKETLRGTIEELQTANEELRSANEEYMSANEELKSANEELKTSREELRSVNEELTTVNTERENKIEELTVVSDDMRNLLNSTGIATIFIDDKLRIRRFTPTATVLFKFINSDIGRPLEDIASRLKTDGLPRAARQVLENLIPVEREVETEDGQWFSLRVYPYRTGDNSIAGVVATFTDVGRLKAALAYSQGIIDTVREPMLVLNEELRVISASRAFYRMFRATKEDTEGHLIFDLGDREWDIPKLREMIKEVLLKNTVFDEFRIDHDFPAIGKKALLLNARRVYDETGIKRSILLAIEDITDRKGV